MLNTTLRIVKIVALLAYALILIGLVIQGGGGDYRGLMHIGQRFNAGQDVWNQSTDPNWYPLPMVLIFSFFAALPSWLSVLLWYGAPVLFCLWISDWDLTVLLFAPLLSLFLQGQSSFIAIVGLWGYMRYRGYPLGSIFLALCAFKPQLLIFPLGYALYQWYVSRRYGLALVFAASVGLICLPAFYAQPDWVYQFLHHLRPQTYDSIAGLLPKLFMLPTPYSLPWLFWPVAIAVVVGFVLWRRNKLTFKEWMLLGFVVNPWGMIYDMTQLVPLLYSKRDRLLAAALGIPVFIVLSTHYDETSWALGVLIPFGLLLYVLRTPLSNVWHTLRSPKILPMPTIEGETSWQ